MGEFSFVSRLESSWREELEALMYFNPRQHNVVAGIEESIAMFGLPKITEEDGWLKVSTEKNPFVQTIFAMTSSADEPEIAGLIVYVRNDAPCLTIMHIGVAERFSISGQESESMLALKMILELKKVARQIKGVEYLSLIYGQGSVRKMPVN